jgi:hypothetical protein
MEIVIVNGKECYKLDNGMLITKKVYDNINKEYDEHFKMNGGLTPETKGIK